MFRSTSGKRFVLYNISIFFCNVTYRITTITQFSKPFDYLFLLSIRINHATNVAPWKLSKTWSNDSCCEKRSTILYWKKYNQYPCMGRRWVTTYICCSIHLPTSDGAPLYSNTLSKYMAAISHDAMHLNSWILRMHI